MFETIEQKSAGECPYCGRQMLKHIIKEGSYYHVTSYYVVKNGAASHCSEPNCENNHGPGHCVPLDAKLKTKTKVKKTPKKKEKKEKIEIEPIWQKFESVPYGTEFIVVAHFIPPYMDSNIRGHNPPLIKHCRKYNEIRETIESLQKGNGLRVVSNIYVAMVIHKQVK